MNKGNENQTNLQISAILCESPFIDKMYTIATNVLDILLYSFEVKKINYARYKSLNKLSLATDSHR